MDRLLNVWLILLFGLSAMPLLASSAENEPRIVGVFEGIEREIGVSDDGQLVGRFSPYYRCVFDRVGGSFRFIEMPLAQMLYQLRNGGISVALPLVQTSERDRYADFGGRLFQTEYVYLLVDNLPPLRNTTGLTYAFVRRFVGDQLLQGSDPKVIRVSNWGQAVQMLRLGRADVVVLPRVLVDQYMADYEGTYYERTAAWVDLSLYVSHARESSLSVEAFRQAIRQCRNANDKNGPDSLDNKKGLRPKS